MSSYVFIGRLDFLLKASPPFMYEMVTLVPNSLLIVHLNCVVSQFCVLIRVVVCALWASIGHWIDGTNVALD